MAYPVQSLFLFGDPIMTKRKPRSLHDSRNRRRGLSSSLLAFSQSGRRLAKKLDLQIERLEPRQLLAGELFPDFEKPTPAWFEVVSTAKPTISSTPKVPGTVQASVLIGPAELVQADWILRLSATATSEFTTLSEAKGLLDKPGVEFQVLHGLGLPGMLVARSRSIDLESAQAVLEQNTKVAAFERDQVVVTSRIPNDDEFDTLSMIGLDNQGRFGGRLDADIDATDAWDLFPGTPGSSSVVIGVIDSGNRSRASGPLLEYLVEPRRDPRSV